MVLIGTVYLLRFGKFGCYVGMTTWVPANRRAAHHCGHLLRGTHSNHRMVRAFRRSGEFDFQVLEVVRAPDRGLLAMKLRSAEARQFALLRPTLNLAGPGGGRI